MSPSNFFARSKELSMTELPFTTNVTPYGYLEIFHFTILEETVKKKKKKYCETRTGFFINNHQTKFDKRQLKKKKET